MRANYTQLSKFCPKGRELRQAFDEDDQPGKHRERTKAYFDHVNDCFICKHARAELLLDSESLKRRSDNA